MIMFSKCLFDHHAKDLERRLIHYASYGFHGSLCPNEILIEGALRTFSFIAS